MIKRVFLILMVAVFLLSLVSAGVGIKMTEGSIMLQEGEGRCINVGAYNPFETGTQATIIISDELKEVLTEQEVDNKYLPPGTSSDNAIPLKFCFKVSQVYERSYIAGKVVDKLECGDQPMKEYRGEIAIESTSSGVAGGGSGGSATKMSVSQPFIVRVACNSYGWDFSLVYIFVAILSAGVVGIILFRKYRKPKSERLKEKMMKLQDEMRKSKVK